MENDKEKTGSTYDLKNIKIPKSGGCPIQSSQTTGPPSDPGGTKVTKPPERYRSCLDTAQAIDPYKFIHIPRKKDKPPPTTVPNVEYMLKEYGIRPQYNVIKKKLLIHLPDFYGSTDNADNVAMTQILSLANLNGMQTGLIPSFVEMLADRNQINPVADWIKQKPWDGIDRLPVFFDTLTEADGYPKALKETLMRRWLISAVAAALKPSGFRSRGVLTLQGPQSIGKTAWVNALVPDVVLREEVVKLDHHLDAGNKDSLLIAVSHWIVEIGELDSSFRKDIARLKGFITADRDIVRRPYARTESEYQRRTVFCATVNEHDFLVDNTGSTRWWTIAVSKINFEHKIDMQQLFAQMAIEFELGEQWWLTQAEERFLEEHNKSHAYVSVIRERVLSAIDPELTYENDDCESSMTPTEVLKKLNIDKPTNSQCKECAAVLRDCYGDSRRIQGQNKWRVRFLPEENSFSELHRKRVLPNNSTNKDDLY